jgi:hypothetical protein
MRDKRSVTIHGYTQREQRHPTTDKVVNRGALHGRTVGATPQSAPPAMLRRHHHLQPIQRSGRRDDTHRHTRTHARTHTYNSNNINNNSSNSRSKNSSNSSNSRCTTTAAATTTTTTATATATHTHSDMADVQYIHQCMDAAGVRPARHGPPRQQRNSFLRATLGTACRHTQLA